MLELARTVRFCLNGGAVTGPKHNTYAGWPAMRGLGRYYELHVRCAGAPDPVSGYFINIKHIDQAVRAHVLPYLASLVDGPAPSADVPLGRVMRRIVALLQRTLAGSVVEVRLNLTPFHSLAMRSRDMDHVILRQAYEFSAAHRLHVPGWDARRNQAVFGKCNNPSGHGHNYQLEVAVRVPIGPSGRVLRLEDLDALVDAEVIQKLDHKHLNLDVPQFAKRNPSVENIAQVIHGMLASPARRLGAVLEEVSVWETGKTVCTYGGPARTSRRRASRK